MLILVILAILLLTVLFSFKDWKWQKICSTLVIHCFLQHLFKISLNTYLVFHFRGICFYQLSSHDVVSNGSSNSVIWAITTRGQCLPFTWALSCALLKKKLCLKWSQEKCRPLEAGRNTPLTPQTLYMSASRTACTRAIDFNLFLSDHLIDSYNDQSLYRDLQ